VDSNESFGFMKGGTFLDYLSIQSASQDVSVPWSSLVIRPVKNTTLQVVPFVDTLEIFSYKCISVHTLSAGRHRSPAWGLFPE
jgi:hypothetical protein